MRAWISGRLPIDTLLAFALGVVFLAITLLLEVFLGSDEASLTIRVTLALAAAGIGAGIPGLLNFAASPGKGLAIKGSGALVFFLVVYLVDPLTSQPNYVPDIEQFTVVPSRIIPGQVVTIAWRARNADIVRLLPLNKEWQNDQSVSDSVTTMPITNTTYVLELFVKGAPVATREATVVVSPPVCTTKAEQVILRTGPGERFPEVARLNKRVRLAPIDYSTREYQPDGRVIQSEWMRVRWEGENNEGWAPAADLDCPSGILDVLPVASTIPPTPTVTPTPTSTSTPTLMPTATPTPVLPTPTFTPFPTAWASLQVFPTEVDRGNLVKISIDTKNAGMVELQSGPGSTVVATYPNPEPNFKPRAIWDKPEKDTDYNLIVNNLSATPTYNIYESIRVNIPECKVTSLSTVFLRKGPGDGFDDEKIPLKFGTTFQPVAFRGSGYETGGENSPRPSRPWYFVTNVTLPDPKENAGLETHEGWVGLFEFAAPDTPLFTCQFLNYPEGQLEIKDEDPPPLICDLAKSTLEFRSAPSTASESRGTVYDTYELTPLGICNFDYSKEQWILATSPDFPDEGWVQKIDGKGIDRLECPNWAYYQKNLCAFSCSLAAGTTLPSECTADPVPPTPTATGTPTSTATPPADRTATAIRPTPIAIGTPTSTATPPAEETAKASAAGSTATISPPAEGTATAVPSTPTTTGTPTPTVMPERPFDFTYQLVIPGYGAFGSVSTRSANHSFRLPEGYAAVGAPEVLIKQLNGMIEHHFHLSPIEEGADLFWVVENPNEETKPALVRVRIWAGRR